MFERGGVQLCWFPNTFVVKDMVDGFPTWDYFYYASTIFFLFRLITLQTQIYYSTRSLVVDGFIIREKVSYMEDKEYGIKTR